MLTKPTDCCLQPWTILLLQNVREPGAEKRQTTRRRSILIEKNEVPLSRRWIKNLRKTKAEPRDHGSKPQVPLVNWQKPIPNHGLQKKWRHIQYYSRLVSTSSFIVQLQHAPTAFQVTSHKVEPCSKGICTSGSLLFLLFVSFPSKKKVQTFWF